MAQGTQQRGRAPSRTQLAAWLVLAFAVLMPGTAAQPSAPEYWPTDGWRESTPESQGIDSATLLKLFDYVREHHTRVHSVLLIRNGYVVLDASFFPYAGDTVHDLASITKSVTSTLIGVAIQDGKIAGPDARALSFFAPADTRGKDGRNADVTLADLLTMRSGFACDATNGEQTLREMMHAPDWAAFALHLPMRTRPGTRFEYCSPNFHLLSAVISKATLTPAADYARSALFAPLGIHKFIWPADPQGVTHGWGDLHLRPRDAAKLGLLWLNGGSWDGKRLVAESWSRTAMAPLTKTTSHDAGYGYGFWAFVGPRAGEFEALGRGGQRITVAPRLKAVVVLTGSGFEPGDIGQFVAAAVKSDHALPANPGAVEKLHRAIEAALLPPPAGASTPIPEMAKAISGKKYKLEANPLDLVDFTLDFKAPDSAAISMTTRGSESQVYPVSLNARPALSPGKFGLAVALAGHWDGNTFLLDYDEIANNHAYRFLIRFSGNTVEVKAEAPGAQRPLVFGGSAE
jgi:CubicO group peptidase (beta-lactamase class C family)